MRSPTLKGHSILIVEDEAIIVMDLTMALESAGAEVTSTGTLKHALLLVEHDGLSAAILDHGIKGSDSSLLSKRLKERGVPFLIYSGHSDAEAVKQGVPFVSKPASHQVLVEALEDLIRRAPTIQTDPLP